MEEESEFETRQWSILLDAIQDYRLGFLPLNQLIFRIEAITSALNRPVWTDYATSVVGDLEQINAAMRDAKSGLGTKDRKYIDRRLRDVETRVRKLRPPPNYWFQKHVGISVWYVRIFLHQMRVFLAIFVLGWTYSVFYISYDLIFSAKPEFPTYFWIVIVGMIFFIMFACMGFRFVNNKLKELKR